MQHPRAGLLGADGVLVWVDPIPQGKTREALDPLLRDVSSRGPWVSAHPDLILKMGVKGVLYRTKRSAAEFHQAFPARLQQLLAYLVREVLIIDGRLGMDPNCGELFEDAVKAVVGRRRVLARFEIATPKICDLRLFSSDIIASFKRVVAGCWSGQLDPPATAENQAAVPAQYFGRCDTTCRRACSIGARDGAGRIYRVGLPLTDLKVTLDGVELKAGFALGGWLAFEKMGDHLALYFMHFWANDDARKLAEGVKAALAQINIATFKNVTEKLD